MSSDRTSFKSLRRYRHVEPSNHLVRNASRPYGHGSCHRYVDNYSAKIDPAFKCLPIRQWIILLARIEAGPADREAICANPTTTARRDLRE